MSLPRLIAYISDWHQSKSPAFKTVLADLEPYVMLEFQPIEQYDSTLQDCAVVFCQQLPINKLPIAPRFPIAWLPMADNYLLFPPSFWETMPAYVRIMTFSTLLAELVVSHGSHLPHYYAQFYLNPDAYPPVSWDHSRRLFYWNRVHLLSERALHRMCQQLKIDTLLFRPTIDPTLPQSNYYTPTDTGDYQVQILEQITNHADYLSQLQRTQIYLAPRAIEGIGLTVLEALASGCAVIASDFSTMNEYIQHGENGILLPYEPQRVQARDARYNELQRWRKRTRIGRWYADWMARQPFPPLLDDQSLAQIDLTQWDLQQLGTEARHQHRVGYQRWLAQCATLAEFLTDNDA